MPRLFQTVTPVAVLFACTAIGALVSPAHAQCVEGWLPGTPNSDMNGSIRWLRMWDPDGAGKQSPVLVAAGDFFGPNGAGIANANRIATWDGANWSALGDGLDGGGYCVTSLDSNNHLYVVGAGFANAGGVSARRIAEWSGSAWNGLGTGTGNTPALALLSVVSLDADSIVVTGAFTSVADVTGTNRVAGWKTTTGWFALGDGMSSTTSCSVVMPNGDLVVGGAALTTGSGAVTVNRIARWDGVEWHPLGDGLNGLARCLLVMPNGDLIVGGAFTMAGTAAANRIARWDGTTWSAIGQGMNVDVYALEVMPNGDLIAAGDFTTADGNPANRIARWNGAAWTALGTGLPAVVRALAVLPNGELAVGGDFTSAGGVPAARFARYVFCDNACPADFNRDGSVNSQDYFDFLIAFFDATDNADFNGDGNVNSQDYFDFVTAFFEGC